jgi:hypothetical protein
MRKLTIVFFDAGGGHRNAAEALRSTLTDRDLGWDVEFLNIQDLLDSVDVVRGVTGIRVQDAYNLMLRKGWTRLSPQLLLSLQGLIRLYHSRIVKLLKNYWSQHPTQMVLSVIPHFNRAIGQSICESLPDGPFVTMLTDLSDYPPHFWIEPESQYIICGTQKATSQALTAGHARNNIFETSGMVLKPRFYDRPIVDRDSQRERLGLRRDLPTGLVLFGGHGSQSMLQIAKRLEASQTELQLVMLCGHNEKLKTQLQAMRTRNRMVVESFTTSVDVFMAISDFFIGKPGPGSISEALQFDLPVIVERNSRTMPQERYNTEWVSENRFGIVLPSFAEIASGVDRLLEPASFAAFKGNVRAYKNRALLEVPVILDTIFKKHTAENVARSAAAHFSVPLSGAGWAALT